MLHDSVESLERYVQSPVKGGEIGAINSRVPYEMGSKVETGPPGVSGHRNPVGRPPGYGAGVTHWKQSGRADGPR